MGFVCILSSLEDEKNLSGKTKGVQKVPMFILNEDSTGHICYCSKKLTFKNYLCGILFICDSFK